MILLTQIIYTISLLCVIGGAGYGICYVWTHPVSILEKWKQEAEDKFPLEQEDVVPKIDVKIFSTDGMSRYKPPFKKYILTIQNLNKNSATIANLRIQFMFKNLLENVKPIPLVNTGENMVVGVNSYYEGKDGVHSYEEQPSASALTKSFSLEIQKVKINGQEANSNILIFSSDKWPDETAFGADIIIDASRTPSFFKTPEKINTFEGIYFYEIKGKKFSGKINGIIP